MAVGEDSTGWPLASENLPVPQGQTEGGHCRSNVVTRHGAKESVGWGPWGQSHTHLHLSACCQLRSFLLTTHWCKPQAA